MLARRIRLVRPSHAALALALLLASCGGGDDDSEPAPDETEQTDDSEPAADETEQTDDSEPAADETEQTDDSEPAADETEQTDDSEPAADDNGSSNADLLAALLFAAEVEAASDGASDLYRQYLTQVFPCSAEGYIEIFGDFIEPPFDAATVQANAESGQSLSISLIDRASKGPEAHLASLDGLVECVGGLYEAKQWDLAFQVSDGSLDLSASEWLGYAACVLDAVAPTEEELVASHYYWYYDSGASDGPLGDPASYLDLASDLQARWSTTHGDSSSSDDPCVHPV